MAGADARARQFGQNRLSFIREEVRVTALPSVVCLRRIRRLSPVSVCASNPKPTKR